MELIDGKKISLEIKEEVRERVRALKAKGKDLTLAVIQVGNDPASSVYVRNKKKACEFCEMGSVSHELPEETREEDLLKLIDTLNRDPKVGGILVQLPLPVFFIGGPFRAPLLPLPLRNPSFRRIRRSNTDSCP